MRDDDEQKLDPDTRSAYQRLERLMCQGTPPVDQDGDPTDEYKLIEGDPIPWAISDYWGRKHPDLTRTIVAQGTAQAGEAWQVDTSFTIKQSDEPAQPDLHGNVFRQEWIDTAIKKGQAMLEDGTLLGVSPDVIIIDESVEFTEADMRKAQAYFQQPPRNYAKWFGLEKQSTQGRLIPPAAEGNLLDIWRRWFPEQPDANGFYPVGPSESQPYEPEQWWQEAMRYMQNRIVAILGIPEDYLTEIHRSDLDALAEELREKIEDHYE